MHHSHMLLSLSLMLSITCVAAGASEPVALAQAPKASSSIAGIVRDSSDDQPIDQALVVLECVCLGAPLETLTNARGIYTFSGLSPGRYSITVFAGRAQETKIVALGGASKLRGNFAINPGSATITTIVVEATPVVSHASTMMTVDMERAKKLPVGSDTSRDFTAVVDLVPTASRDAAGISFAGTSARESYAKIRENRVESAAKAKRSTFSIDVDTASYSNVRRFLRDGALPPSDAVRIEELLNYFSYDYPAPRPGADPFSITTEIADCPWNSKARLLHIGLRAQDIPTAQLPPRNLVFLIDVSGSMNSPDKLPLLRRAMKLLVSTLGAQDHVSIVVYAGASGVVLAPTSGADQATIMAALDRLEAGGSTNGGAGIERAYALARQQFDGQAINRVILATDGDFNVGTTDIASLQSLIEHERESGVFLSVLGFGAGNLNDATMEMLANKGNGNYAYIDSIAEARKVLVDEAGATLVTVAKDVKIQVEFDPKQVASYRLIGYENRVLAAKDFNDDRKDAGEVGAGHSVTALYELVLTKRAKPKQPLAELRVRYKPPNGSTSKLSRAPVVDTKTTLKASSNDFRFAAAVAEYGMLLRKSSKRGTASWTQAKALAAGAIGRDPGNHRREFIELLTHAEALSSRTRRRP